MAVNKTVTLEAKTKGFDEAEKQIEDVAKAAKVANDSVEGLNKTFEEVYGEIQPLTTRMGEAEDRLYELAAAGDTTSREYQELLTKVGEYRKVQIQTDLAVDSAATTLGQKLGGALTGATSGFAAVQGVMGLVGGESEQLEKALLKVQSALAIQQGVQGIREAIPSFKQFGSVAVKAFKGMTSASKAFALTGIGVVITAVAALSYALNKLEEQEQKAEEARKKRHEEEMARFQEEITEKRKAIQEVNKQVDIEQAAREQQVKLLQAQGKSITQAEFEVAKGFLEATEAKGKALAAAYRDLEKINKKLIKDFRVSQAGKDRYDAEALALAKIRDEKIAANKAEQKLLLDQMNELKKIQEDGYDAIEVLEAQQETDRRNKRKENNKVARDAAKLQAEKLAEIERQRLQNIQDLENSFLDELEAIAEQNFQNTLTEQEQEELAVQDKYFRLETLAADNAEALKEIEIAKANELNDIILQYDQEAYDAKKALDDQAQADKDAANAKELADAKLLQDAKFKMAQDGLALISNITQLFGQKNEKQAKRAFQIDKAAKIASATMSGIEGTINAYKTAQSSPITTLLPVYPVIQAGLAAAFAATNIAAIGQQKFEGGGPGPDVSAGGGGGGTQAPSFNVVGDSNVNQLAELQQQPAQAYVVSGEVTTAQALDRNRVQNATL